MKKTKLIHLFWVKMLFWLDYLSYYSIQIKNKNTLISTSVYSNLNEFKDGSWIKKMGWATKLLLAKNRTPFIPSSKRTMIWAVLDVCAIRFQLSILFNCLDSTHKLGGSQYNEVDSVTLCFLDIHLEKVLIFCDILSFINSFLQVFPSLDPLKYRTPSFSQIYVS